MKETSSNSYGHALKYTGIFGGVQLINLLIGLVRNKLVALILGPAGMGLASLYNSTVSLMGNATNLGLSMSGVKRVSEAYDALPEAAPTGSEALSRLQQTICLIRSLCLITAVLGTLVCAIASPLLSLSTFGDYSHSLGFVLLSPMVGMLAVIGGELAVMKGVRMLRPLALVSFYNVLAAVLITVPIFYFWGRRGIIPSFLLLTAAQLFFTLRYSYRRFPPRFSYRLGFIRRGASVVRLGIAFVLAQIFGSGADFLIRLFLNNQGSLDAVGLYNAGFVLTMVYGGLVFSAMETDYFPRLAAVPQGDLARQNDVVNKQVEVSLLLVSPMLTALLTFLPIILPLLFSPKFNPILPMVQVTILALYLRALKLPLAYMSLAKGDSRSFLFLELTYAVVVLILVCSFYQLFGLVGTGYALLLTALLDFLLLTVYTHCHYGYRMSRSVLLLTLLQLPLGALTFIVCRSTAGPHYWLPAILLSIVSLAISLAILHRKTHLLQAMKKKICH